MVAKLTRGMVGRLRRVAALAATAAVSLLDPSAAPAQDAPAAGPRLLVIAIDGLRPDYLLQADRHGLRIPNLRRFLAEGAYATAVRGVVPTVTYPSFTTVITGVSPARHGIVANTTFDPLLANAGGWYWYAEDIRVPTLWDAAAAAGLSTASVHWPVSVGAPVRWNLPQIWRTGTPDDRKLLRALATPGLQDTLESLVGEPYADGIDESIEGDEKRGRFAVALMKLHRPDVITTYFTALDHEQHETGPHTARDHAVLERIDAVVGGLVEAAQALSGGRTVVAVVSDHGFEPTHAEVSLLTAFREAGLVRFAEGAATPSEWRATVWPAAASAAVVLKDSTDSATRAEVAGLLAQLAADPSSGIDRVIDRAELARRGGFPGADFLVNLKPGYQLGSRVTGPLVASRAPGGMHGYLPDNPQMNTSFLVMGPGIRRGASLGEIDLRDVAPTLAELIGVRMPGAEGKTQPVRDPAAPRR